jgi:hypothetical protein
MKAKQILWASVLVYLSDDENWRSELDPRLQGDHAG